MTRRICVFLLLAVLLILPGCQTLQTVSGDAYIPATDNPFLTPNYDNTSIAQSENGYYIAAKNYLQFVDNETGVAVPLCSKPNCLHNAETDEDKRALCDAFFPNGPLWLDIFYLDHDLYVFSAPLPEFVGTQEDGHLQYYYQLIRMKEDGTERTELFRIERPFGCNINRVLIHRGVFYYTYTGYDEDGEGGEGVYARPLNQKNGEAVLLHSAEYKISRATFTGMAAFGNRLYLSEYVSRHCMTVRIIDLETGEISAIPFPEGMNSIDHMTRCGDQLILSACERYGTDDPYDNGTVKQMAIYRCNMDGSGLTKVMDAGPNAVDVRIAADEQYLYLDATAQDPETGEYIAVPPRIFDRDFREICTVTYEDFALEGLQTSAASPIPMRGAQAMFMTSQKNLASGRYETIYMTISHEDIAAGNPVPRVLFGYDWREYNDIDI